MHALSLKVSCFLPSVKWLPWGCIIFQPHMASGWPVYYTKHTPQSRMSGLFFSPQEMCMQKHGGMQSFQIIVCAPFISESLTVTNPYGHVLHLDWESIFLNNNKKELANPHLILPSWWCFVRSNPISYVGKHVSMMLRINIFQLLATAPSLSLHNQSG